MPFFQTPATLDNQYSSDRVLRAALARALPPAVLAEIEPQLLELGALAADEFHNALVADHTSEPTLTQWDAWGRRVDRIELTPHWKRMAPIAVKYGLVATPYERRHGRYSRLHQFALLYLFDTSSGVYTCPLAMTDGAAKTLSVSGNRALLDRALPRLTSRDPERAWTSGQWMTERTGGSDVAICETIAKHVEDGRYKLYGTKWFTSAATSDIALTLARPEGNPPGGAGLALFYLETRDASGQLNGIQINRLKNKLGTKMVPTAELTLDGTLATLVSTPNGGIKNITPMLSVTRTWNAIAAVACMRRALALSRDYASKRIAFGSPLSEKPLHVDTLAAMQAEFEAAFMLAFRTAELIGKEEAGEISAEEAALLRLLTPLAKLTTAKQAVAITSEALEAFGGAGYVEDTGLPRLLRDAQVLPIWEGTTNVLSLDVLRVLARGGSIDVVVREVERCVQSAPSECRDAALAAKRAISHAADWLANTSQHSLAAVEAGGRRFAMTLGRALELALLVEHAKADPRSAAAARLFARRGVDLIDQTSDSSDAAALAAG